MQITEPSTVEQYYQALLRRDSQFLGIFFAGVKTTGIFCLPTCRARKPLPKNVEFFSHFKEALDHGYRPCKICQPTENAHETPENVRIAIQLVKDNPKEKINDQRLRDAGVSPEAVRRWFKAQYGMTFHAYQRMFRINTAFQELKKGGKTTDAAFDSGYESLSGFGYTFKKVVGKTPKESTTRQLIQLQRFTTPLGPMFAAATEKGLCLLEFVDRRMLETEFRDLQRLLNATIVVGENNHTRQAVLEMEEYFAGKRQSFSVALHAPGTAFQQEVWRTLQQIPYGTTHSYQQQAELLGKPNAVRAVATANGCNRIAIIIPCHRIIGKDGKLRGYGGGLERKQWLLDLEKKN